MAPFAFGIVCMSGGQCSTILCWDIFCVFYIQCGTQLWESPIFILFLFFSLNSWGHSEHLLCMSVYHGHIFVTGGCLDDCLMCKLSFSVSFTPEGCHLHPEHTTNQCQCPGAGTPRASSPPSPAPGHEELPAAFRPHGKILSCKMHFNAVSWASLNIA